MGKKRKKSKASKPTTKIPSSNVPRIDETLKIKREIQELEDKKKTTGKGIRGFLRNLSINKDINNKKGFITAKDQIRSTSKRIELMKVQTELENAKANLQEARKKSQVDFGNFGTPQSNQLKMEDIFK